METERGLTTEDLAGAHSPASVETEHADADVAVTPAGDESAGRAEHDEPLLSGEELQTFRSRWDEIQVNFVDEPRRATENADALVAELMQRLATLFAEERGALERQWGTGDEVSTEDLRVALTRYRSFFNRLLAT